MMELAIKASMMKITDRIFLAGDVQLNGSLNAAMVAGEAAAMGLMEIL